MASLTGTLATDLLLAIILLMLSGSFSGLTLGLLGLDVNGLEIVIKGDDLKEREYARKILPVRRRGNLLLCTLLLGNTVVNAVISVLLSSLTTGQVGFILSTLCIVIFGEIAPQAVCSRHGLRIGAKALPLVRTFITIFYIVAYPASLILDRILGTELGIVYDKAELRQLVRMHSIISATGTDDPVLQQQESRMMEGALMFSQRTVREVMTPLSRVFMLNVSARLDFDTLSFIFKTGHSRIPVFDKTPYNVVGVVFTKDFILVDPDDEIPIRSVLPFYGNAVLRVSASTTLDKCLNRFKSQRFHMAIAFQRRHTNDGDILSEVVGIVTLEDLLEEILQEEIIDETDRFVDMQTGQGELHRSERDMGLYNFLYKKRYHKYEHLGEEELGAVCSYLRGFVAGCTDEFIGDSELTELVLQSEVLEYTTSQLGAIATQFDAHKIPFYKDSQVSFCQYVDDAAAVVGGVGSEETGAQGIDDKAVLFRRGQKARFMILVLDGRVLVRAGEDGFISKVGPWISLGDRLLCSENYRPDFTATLEVTDEPVRMLCVKRSVYLNAVRATRLAEQKYSTTYSIGPAASFIK